MRDFYNLEIKIIPLQNDYKVHIKIRGQKKRENHIKTSPKNLPNSADKMAHSEFLQVAKFWASGSPVISWNFRISAGWQNSGLVAVL